MNQDDQTHIQALWGKFKASLPGFKARKAQRLLIAEGARALCSETHGAISIIEAPTGTGKSLGYLFSAAPAIERGTKVVIAPSTIALQEQLVNKDLPLFQKHTGLKFDYALIKGRGRYACPLKLERLSTTDIIGKRHYRDLSAALDKGTWDGDFDQWPTQLTPAFRSPVASDKSDCLKRACTSFEGCPYYEAKKRTDDATVLITNHAMLATDLCMGGGQILPNIEESLYVVDEAHQFAETCSNHFRRGFSIDKERTKIISQINRIFKLPVEATPQYRASRTALVNNLKATIKQMDALLVYLDNTFGHDEREGLPDNTPLCRFKSGTIPQALRQRLSAIKARLDKVTLSAKQFDSYLGKCPAEPRQRYKSAQHSLMTLIEGIELWLEDAQHPVAKWISAGGKSVEYRLDAVPVRVGHFVKEALWDRCKGALITSGTLTALNSFDFFMEKVGLSNHATVRTLSLPSIYKYEEQATLYLPTCTANPKDRDAYEQYLATELSQLIPLYRGTLILFSSKRQMTRVYNSIPDHLKFNVQCQGDLPRKDMLAAHKGQIDSGYSSVLFGLASMSEGLDLPGAYCEHVIVAQLPFRSPACPVLATEHEWAKDQGGNPFFEIEVPIVSVRLAQSVGRLLRREDDFGQVSLLDPRLSRPGYGRTLLSSLPSMPRVTIEPSGEQVAAG